MSKANDGQNDDTETTGNVIDLMVALRDSLAADGRLGISPHIEDSLVAYRDHGRRTGGFLESVLHNDLSAAISRADHENIRIMRDIVGWCQMNLPSGAWKSPEAVEAWIEKGGSLGRHADAIITDALADDGLPKIFVVVDGHMERNVYGVAIAEDGAALTGHLSSDVNWLRHDMGLTGDWKHDIYDKHYPKGYTLVDLVALTKEQLDAHVGFMAAVERHKAFKALELVPPTPSHQQSG